MSEIRVNGVSLYYEEHGAGAPIVCIHGTGSSSVLWSEAAEELATHGRTIVYDRRGFSRSERPEPFVTDVHQHTDDAAALIDALAAAPAIVIGRSQGGEIAVDLALRYPDRVRALALLEGGGLSLSEALRRWLAELDEHVFAAAEVDMNTVGETMLRRVLGDSGWEGLPEPVKQIFTANGPAIVAEHRGGLLDVSAEQLGAIVQPTLIVGAVDSGPAFAEATNLTAAAMPSATVEWVEGGHIIDPAHPAVLAFVDDVLALKEEPYRVILLPGAILPADLAYGALVDALGDEVEALAKDLEIYAGDAPPDDYSLDTEVAGLLREADARGWERFHLVGYSGGGAAALAAAARFPDRLVSLALLEPAWAGDWNLSEAERGIWREFEKLDALTTPDEFMAAFVRLELRPGVAPPAPPPGPPPPWMAKRPAGIRAFTRTFRTYELNRESLRRFDRPVYYALGGLSNPDQYGEIADRLSRVFDDFTLEVFEKRHHFDPPHRIEPERLARSLRTLWERAESVIRYDRTGQHLQSARR